MRIQHPVSEADIETAASYLRHCGLDPDAQRLLEVFKGLKAAFCSVGEYIPISDDSMANRKFYAQDRALMLSEHLEDLIGTLPTILTRCKCGAPLDDFTVTLEDLHELTDKMVAVSTMRNRGNLPKPVGKRGKEHVLRYSDMLTWWQDKNFEAPLPDEPTAREQLGVKS